MCVGIITRETNAIIAATTFRIEALVSDTGDAQWVEGVAVLAGLTAHVGGIVDFAVCNAVEVALFGVSVQVVPIRHVAGYALVLVGVWSETADQVVHLALVAGGLVEARKTDTALSESGGDVLAVVD